MDGWSILIIFGVYLLLQLWILPKLGISTCMRGACSASPRRKKRTDETAAADHAAEETESIS